MRIARPSQLDVKNSSIRAPSVRLPAVFVTVNVSPSAQPSVKAADATPASGPDRRATGTSRWPVTP